jgi:hypothetical protein
MQASPSRCRAMQEERPLSVTRRVLCFERMTLKRCEFAKVLAARWGRIQRSGIAVYTITRQVHACRALLNTGWGLMD